MRRHPGRLLAIYIRELARASRRRATPAAPLDALPAARQLTPARAAQRTKIEVPLFEGGSGKDFYLLAAREFERHRPDVEVAGDDELVRRARHHEQPGVAVVDALDREVTPDAEEEAAEAGDTDKAINYAREASRKLDKAVSKGVIHQNQAANRKSSIAKKAAAL